MAELELETMGADEIPADDLAELSLMQAELLELSLWRLRREMMSDPGLVPIRVGAGQAAEQTVPGNQRDPYNGLTVYNPGPASLSVGFQSGAGLLAPATVPPFSWVSFPERFVNVSVALLNPQDAQTATYTVSLLRLRIPPAPNAGPIGAPQPLASLPAGSFNVGAGAVLDLGTPRPNHSVIVNATGVLTGGAVTLQVSHDAASWASPAATAAINAAGVYSANVAGFAARYVRAAITTAIAGGGSIAATVASS